MLERLLRFCQEHDADCYLLGDLFDVWLGRAQLSLTQTRREIVALQEACGSGIDVVLVPGNRDFLVDDNFEIVTGVAVGGDHIILEHGSESWHLSHGDLFGSSDVGYQRLRKILRSAPFRWLIRILPLQLCKLLASMLRRRSMRSLRSKDPASIQPDTQMVERLIDDGFDRVVCGHYHRPHEETGLGVAGKGTFTILEAFEERGGHLFLDDDGAVEVRNFEEEMPEAQERASR